MLGLDSLHQSPGLSIAYDHCKDWIFLEWRGFHDEDSVRAGCLLLLHYVQLKKCTKVLTTDTLSSSKASVVDEWLLDAPGSNSWESAASWLGSEFYRQLADAGLKYLAWVNSSSPVNRRAANAALAASEALQPKENRLLIITFDDVASAYEWLQHRPVRPGAVSLPKMALL